MVIPNEKKIKIANANKTNPYVDITPYELGITFPFVYYTGFHPDNDEILIYAAPGVTFKSGEQIVNYTGNSAGVSIKTGGTGSRTVRDTVRQANIGDLIITNKRIMFIGKDDSFEFQVSTISIVKFLDSNSFVIQSGCSSKNVWLDIALVTYAYGMIKYAIDKNTQEVDIPTLIKVNHDKMTPEEIALCNQVRNECSKMKVSKSKNNQGCLWGIVKLLLILLIVLIVGGIITIFIVKNWVDNNDSSVNTPQYSLTEILAFDNHPKVYDSYEDTKTFYDGIGAVKVLSIQKYSQIQRALKKTTDDDTLLYFIQHSTDKKYTGTVKINLYDESVSADMTVDKAIELLVSYLPNNFFECYLKDSSYKYSNNDHTVYVYSCRLNDTGVAYHNDGNNQYPYYYSFKIIHFENTNQWKLETSYAPYGDKDLGWIQKYSDEWNVDFKDYAT